MSIELVVSDILENAFNIDYKMMFSVIFRTAIVTLLIVFVIKWLGNKGMGQLSTIELIIILGLGNAVSEPMLNPTETSIPQGFAVIIIAIAVFKLYDYLTTKYRKFSKMIVSKPILLVKDGKILDDSLMKARISREEFESYLRLSGTDDISDIKSSYLEINGQVSFIKKREKTEKNATT
ncbi:MAG TPA: YetF domain-containing protein, partial [Nitrososphaeraceae archaeon]|nr:YetF domain-containing protein [Nitrososphaeraceae archaeon]